MLPFSDPPEIVLKPCTGEIQKYQVIEGYDAMFTCEIDANPPVNSTYWMKSYSNHYTVDSPQLEPPMSKQSGSSYT